MSIRFNGFKLNRKNLTVGQNISLSITLLILLPLAIQFLSLADQVSGEADVIINEIMYHPPSELEGEEYIELYNKGKISVDISGWEFTKGISYTFAPNTIIQPNSYLVVCRSIDDFRSSFDSKIPAVGNFIGSLRNRGERVTLSDETGKTIDNIKYGDRSPWPVGADGYSSSLERICPTGSTDATNWAPTPLPIDGRSPSGTPGQQNLAYSINSPPSISDVTFSPQNPGPDEPITIRAKISGEGEVTLLYHVVKSGHSGNEIKVPMSVEVKTEIGTYYKGVVPNQSSHSIVRFRIHVFARDGSYRFVPHPNQLRPAYSVFIRDETDVAQIPVGLIINVDQELYETTKTEEENRRHQTVMMMLKSGTDLEPIWLYHTLEQELNNPQINQLRRLYRKKSEEREGWIKQVSNSQPNSDLRQNLAPQIKKFNQSLFQQIKTILTPTQYTQFLSWYKQESELAPRFRSRGRFRRSIGLETSWFFITTTFDLSHSKFEELKLIYNEGMSAREQVSFRERRELDDSVTDQAQFVLSQEQQARFNQWWAEKAPPEDSDRFRRRSPNQPRAEPSKEGERRQRSRFSFDRPGPQPPVPLPGKSAFIYISPDTNTYQIFDYINVTPRAGGYKVRFHKDQPLNGMTTINLIFEDNPRFVLAEYLSYEVYKRAGVPTEHSEHIRISLDGYQMGYHLLVEQPNRNFLRRYKRDDSGDLYKILWYEYGVIDQHEKKTNSHTGHDNIVNLVSLLDNSKNEEQWKIIRQHFNVEEVINYFAVNLCISNWDGFFNNYFTYHDINGSGKWEIYPWDEDKTWGYYGGGSDDKSLYKMPLTFGMNDTTTLISTGERGGFNGWGRSDQPRWWRPPGYFSGPLLSNPQFRKRFLARLKEIVETIYNESVFLPLINQMELQLEPEIRLRAEEYGQDVDVEIDRFHNNLESIKQHLTKRREFILSQEELKVTN